MLKNYKEKLSKEQAASAAAKEVADLDNLAGSRNLLKKNQSVKEIKDHKQFHRLSNPRNRFAKNRKERNHKANELLMDNVMVSNKANELMR